ncbi:RhoGAP-domain-containing protein [Trichodelitschia bisporula]|uniref:RhoGAP-domain-containing protein n=1 Tax=Trichodelitschia bisporula TaxID=703511 RepID=A0A6G1HN93_9PEZI|nr:RhoGAP-domain-containing protein [Trichodelitschia bisporula]
MQEPSAAVGGQPSGAVAQPVEAPVPSAPQPTTTDPTDNAAQKTVDEVLYSDIGITTLLNRLKQSIATAKDASTFMKKRSNISDDEARECRRLIKSMTDSVHRGDSRQGTYRTALEQIAVLHDRMTDHETQFSLNVFQVHDDLNALAADMEKGRKHWKSLGISAEAKSAEAEAQLRKAKSKYDSLAEEYARVKTGDKTAGRHFGLKGPKSGAQHEQVLQGKVQAAEVDYKSKVQAAQQIRKELEDTVRPQVISSLQNLIQECDSGLTMSWQKYAVFLEKLVLGKGVLVLPLNDGPGKPQPGLGELISGIDNAADLRDSIKQSLGKLPKKHENVVFEQHPTLAPQQAPPSQLPQQTASGYGQSAPRYGQSGASQPLVPAKDPYQQPHGPAQAAPAQQPTYYNPPQQPTYQHPSHSQPYPPASYRAPGDLQPQRSPYDPPPSLQPANYTANSTNPAPYANPQYAMAGTMAPPGRPDSMGNRVFGLSLEELFERDKLPVPVLVHQCLLAVDTFGLDTEGIYRLNGNASHIKALREKFDTDNVQVDFRNPEDFNHDVNNPVGLLKEFLRQLPDPLFTNRAYRALIDAARVPDPIIRRDSVHAVINELPDSHYATLRALVLHLRRVVDHEDKNRMSATNLAVVLAPSVMGTHGGPVEEASLQPRVLETVLLNALQIFDEDE